MFSLTVPLDLRRSVKSSLMFVTPEKGAYFYVVSLQPEHIREGNLPVDSFSLCQHFLKFFFLPIVSFSLPRSFI